jgi:outer membrane lipoprotein carrier protein
MHAITLAAALVAASISTLSPLGAQSPAAQSRAAESAAAALDRAVAAYAKVKTVRATFEQTLTNPLTGTAVSATGEMTQRRPNYLSVRFTDPAGDRIVADGKYLWLYLPSTNPGQVIRTPVGAGASGVPDVTAQFLDSPKSRFAVSDAGRGSAAGRPARALALVARDSTLPFTRATVWVDDADGLVRQFEATDANGVVRKVTITKLAVNVPVDRAAFAFTPPKGVRVYDGSGRLLR